VQRQRANAAVEERERIAAELHDELGQVLGYVKLQTQVARDLLARDEADNAEKALAQLASVAQLAHTDIREFILGARMATALEHGFMPALQGYLEQLQENFSLQIRLQVSPIWDDGRLELGVAFQLLRIVQEALTNARKHAQAQLLCVCLDHRDGNVAIMIQDDGQGFDLERLYESEGLSFGLWFMRWRAESIGGRLEVQSNPAQGTCVTVLVPLQEVDS
jgi:signal transduction histidine kinase